MTPNTMTYAQLYLHVPNKSKLPIYGPLQIQDEEGYLRDEEGKFVQTYFSPFPYQLAVDNFDLICQIGSGAFGIVIMVKYKLFGSYYAMKVLRKETLVKKGYVQKALNEKLLLQSLNCPFTIYLLYFSQDNSNLYFVLPFIRGGELYNLLTQSVRFNENLSKFYAAQVVLAFEYLHRCGVVYRDLKPENILLDHFGFIKLTDFGLSKLISHRTYTFCGTPDYVAPEVILGTGYGKAVDWWALGILTFEMSTGRTPFLGQDQYTTFAKIVIGKYDMPRSLNDDLKNLIAHLLQKDVSKRIGNLKSGVREIKDHPWFEEVNWLALLNRTVVPPFIPLSTQEVSKEVFPDMEEVKTWEVAEEDKYEDSFEDF